MWSLHVRARLLAANRNTITDLSPLADVDGLESVAIDQNAVTDLTPLKDLPRLTFISAVGNQVTSLGAVGGFAPLVLLSVDMGEK